MEGTEQHTVHADRPLSFDRQSPRWPTPIRGNRGGIADIYNPALRDWRLAEFLQARGASLTVLLTTSIFLQSLSSIIDY